MYSHHHNTRPHTPSIHPLLHHYFAIIALYNILVTQAHILLHIVVMPPLHLDTYRRIHTIYAPTTTTRPIHTYIHTTLPYHPYLTHTYPSYTRMYVQLYLSVLLSWLVNVLMRYVQYMHSQLHRTYYISSTLYRRHPIGWVDVGHWWPD